MTKYMHHMANSKIIAENNDIDEVEPLSVARSRIFYDIYEMNGINSVYLEGHEYSPKFGGYPKNG